MKKRAISILLSICVLVSLLAGTTITAGAAEAEYAMFPGNVVSVSQGAYSSYSHSNQNAFDLIGNSDYFAPFSGTVTAIKPNENAVVLQSDAPVYWANGNYDYMSVIFLHDNDISNISIGKHFNQGEIFYQPGVKDPSGLITGSHVHLCVRTGKDKFLNSYGSGNVYPNEALFITNNTQVWNAGGYTWTKTSASIPTPPYELKTGTYYFKNKATGTYLDAQQSGDANGTNVIVCTLNGGNNQKWEVSASSGTGTNTVAISPKHSTRMLNNYGNAVADGNNVCLWEDTGDASQRWGLEAKNGGYIIHSAQNSNVVIAGVNGNAQMATNSGADNQIWILEEPSNTITLDAQGGNCIFSSIQMMYGQAWNLPTPTRGNGDEYIFGGWFSEPNGQGSQYTIGTTYWGSENQTIYAYWIKCYPDAPEINSIAVSGSDITVTWSAVTNATSYVVDYWNADTDTHNYNETTETTYTKSMSDGQYGIRVCAKNASGETFNTDGFHYVSVAYTSCGDNATWSFDAKTGTLTIHGTGAMYDYSSLLSEAAPWQAYWSDIQTVNIEDGITSIGNFAFMECSNLTSIEIPNSVTSIGGRAFMDCTSLTSVTIPDSVTSIGRFAFANTPWLEAQGEFAVVNGILLQYQGNGGAVQIPNNVETIGEYAFCYCDSLTSVTIPNSVSDIGYGAFYECENLTSVVIGNGAKSIGEYAFCSCKNLTNITIPNSVETIERRAFYECTGLMDAYYSGSQEQWDSITINEGNEMLLNATMHFQPAYKLGDVNDDGDIGASDAAIILKWCVATPEMKALLIPADKELAADVDRNGDIGAADAAVILKWCVATPEMKAQLIPEQ